MQFEPGREPLVVAMDMGYGHMRPAHALAERLGVEVLQSDRPPIAVDDEGTSWGRVRSIYEWTTRLSGFPYVGAPLRMLVSNLTDIDHLHPYRDQSRATLPVRRLARAVRNGMGEKLVAYLRETGRPLLSTYFAPALAADAAGCEQIYTHVTDSDIHRIWAAEDPANSRIQYLVPSMRALRRLRAYGVPGDHIHATGYPLPHALLGGEDLGVLRRNLAARIVRLDPKGAFRDSYPDELRTFLGELPDSEEGRPPLVTFAVGGAGAQTEIVRQFLPGLRPAIEQRRIRLALVAGVRRDTEAKLRAMVDRSRLEDEVEILIEDSLERYCEEFTELRARTDVLWTKPSEMTFFGALGLALVLSPPVGVHEWYNRRWARESGAALKQRDAGHAHLWLKEWLDDGLLASAAWSGYTRLPKFGLYRILTHVAAGANGR